MLSSFHQNLKNVVGQVLRTDPEYLMEGG